MSDFIRVIGPDIHYKTINTVRNIRCSDVKNIRYRYATLSNGNWWTTIPSNDPEVKCVAAVVTTYSDDEFTLDSIYDLACLVGEQEAEQQFECKLDDGTPMGFNCDLKEKNLSP